MPQAKKVLDHIRISKADSGGFIAEHHFKDPAPRKGTEPWQGRPSPETHVLKQVAEIGTHVEHHMGGAPAGGKDEGEAPQAAER
jgi:hypothetical protein